MQKFYKTFPFVMILSACQGTYRENFADLSASLLPGTNQGVEIARAELTGPSGGLTTTGLTEDCAGPGLGVKVEGTSAADYFLFDATGNPCDSSEEIFNGYEPVNQRLTDATSIQVHFKDAFGSTKPSLAGTELKPIYDAQGTIRSVLPEDYAVAPEDENLAAGKVIDFADVEQPSGLGQTISAWETETERRRMAKEREEVLSQSSEVLSSMRELDRMASRDLVQAQHEKMLELMARLRDAERRLELEQQRHEITLNSIDKTRVQSESRAQEWEQKEGKLSAERAALQARLSAFETLNQRLSQEKRQQEEAYANRITSLEGQLKEAEGQASKVRRELVLEAAQKIAEAERISYAARLAEQEAKKREAERLKLEGQQLMQRATDLKAGNSVVVPRVSDMFDPLTQPRNYTPPTPLMPLKDVPITLQVKDKTLKDIVEDVFKNVRTVAGPWQVDWQLSGKAQYILEETWTLTAESSFMEIMTHIQNTVQKQNNIHLTFREFEKSRLFVISDE